MPGPSLEVLFTLGYAGPSSGQEPSGVAGPSKS